MATINSLSKVDPPPSSQSHFAKFEKFEPNENASFDDEFSRLASSQNWIPGSQQYKRERTIAMREEISLHYFSQLSQNSRSSGNNKPGVINEERSEDDDRDEIVEVDSQASDGNPDAEDQADKGLLGFQALCRAVDIDPLPSVEECRQALKKKWVNIVDFINARRTGAKIEVWSDFGAFAAYTIQDGHHFDLNMAKEDQILSCFLQKVRGFGKDRKKRNKKKATVGAVCLKARSGRVQKRK